MGYRREPFEVGEWYHCYNRGIDKRAVFTSKFDSERFLQSLYLCNSDARMDRSDFDYYPHVRIFELERSDPLVAIGAYSLMPNHFHLLLQEVVEGGISKFMHKLGTSYTMYFNEKNARVGNLFYKPFRSRMVSRDAHFMHLPHYIHLNVLDVVEPGWRQGGDRISARVLERKLQSYRFSSYVDYHGKKRPESVILDTNARSVLRDISGNPTKFIHEAIDYDRGLN